MPQNFLKTPQFPGDMPKPMPKPTRLASKVPYLPPGGTAFFLLVSGGSALNCQCCWTFCAPSPYGVPLSGGVATRLPLTSPGNAFQTLLQNFSEQQYLFYRTATVFFHTPHTPYRFQKAKVRQAQPNGLGELLFSRKRAGKGGAFWLSRAAPSRASLSTVDRKSVV